MGDFPKSIILHQDDTVIVFAVASEHGLRIGIYDMVENRTFSTMFQPEALYLFLVNNFSTLRW